MPRAYLSTCRRVRPSGQERRKSNSILLCNAVKWFNNLDDDAVWNLRPRDISMLVATRIFSCCTSLELAVCRSVLIFPLPIQTFNSSEHTSNFDSRAWRIPTGGFRFVIRISFCSHCVLRTVTETLWPIWFCFPNRLCRSPIRQCVFVPLPNTEGSAVRPSGTRLAVGGEIKHGRDADGLLQIWCSFGNFHSFYHHEGPQLFRGCSQRGIGRI